MTGPVTPEQALLAANNDPAWVTAALRTMEEAGLDVAVRGAVPTGGPTEEMVEAFKAAWHAADAEGREGERVRDGLAAALATHGGDEWAERYATAKTDFMSRMAAERDAAVERMADHKASLAIQAFTAPDADEAEMMESLVARIADLVTDRDCYRRERDHLALIVGELWDHPPAMGAERDDFDIHLAYRWGFLVCKLWRRLRDTAGEDPDGDGGWVVDDAPEDEPTGAPT